MELITYPPETIFSNINGAPHTVVVYNFTNTVFLAASLLQCTNLYFRAT